MLPDAEHTCEYGEQNSRQGVDTARPCHARYCRRDSSALVYRALTLVEVRRQLPYLQNLARRHCLLVVFFEDDEVKAYATSPARTTEDYYRHVIADKFVYEKRQIVALLRQHGITALLTSPSRLTVDVVNKYIELKRRGI